MHEQPLLGAPRDFVELGNLQRAQCLATQQRSQSSGDGIDLMGELMPTSGKCSSALSSSSNAVAISSASASPWRPGAVAMASAVVCTADAKREISG